MTDKETIIYTLYVKQHNVTGLRYLGYTSKDPLKYSGSGKYWLRHLEVHGNDVTTKIIMYCADKHSLKYWGIYYSNLWNVVDSLSWANLKLEEGSGGHMGHSAIEKVKAKLTGIPKSESHRQKLQGNNKGRKHSDEVNAKKAMMGERNGMFGRQRTEEEKQKIRDSRSLRTPEQNKSSYSRKKSIEEIEKMKRTKIEKLKLRESQ